MRGAIRTIMVVGSAAVSGCSDPQSYPTEAFEPPPSVPTGQQSWPTAGLAFVAGGELQVVDEVSSAATVLLSLPTEVLAFPDWAPDGSRVAFSATVAGSNDPWRIHLLHKDGTLRRLSPQNVYDIAPSWSPDGNRIAFLSRVFPDGEDEIYVMNADGTGRVQLTSGTLAAPGFPAWSPDGHWIAYSWTDVSKPNELNGIYVMRPDGTDAVRVTPSTVVGTHEVAWSPDGRRLAFVDGKQRGIGIINKDGTGLSYMSVPTIVENLAWSPDGTVIAFNDQCPPSESECPRISLWLLRIVDGSLTRASTPFGYHPVWVRRPTATVATVPPS